MIPMGVLGAATPRAAPAPGGDPYWANVVSLLHFDGTDGSTTFTDETGKTWTSSGNAQIDTARAKFGAGSVLFDGLNDWITCTHADLVLGTGDFTIELWLYRAGNTAQGSGAAATFLDMRTAIPQANIALLLTGSTDSSTNARAVVLDINGTSVIVSSAGAITSVFSHVALCRAAGVTRLFIDGVKHGGDFADANNYTSNVIRLGARAIIAGDFRALNGSVDDFRVTRGVARYTSDFTPPAAAFPNS